MAGKQEGLLGKGLFSGSFRRTCWLLRVLPPGTAVPEGTGGAAVANPSLSSRRYRRGVLALMPVGDKVLCQRGLRSASLMQHFIFNGQELELGCDLPSTSACRSQGYCVCPHPLEMQSGSTGKDGLATHLPSLTPVCPSLEPLQRPQTQHPGHETNPAIGESTLPAPADLCLRAGVSTAQKLA